MQLKIIFIGILSLNAFYAGATFGQPVCHLEDVIIIVGLANVLWVDVMRNAFKFQLYPFCVVC